MQKIKNSKLSIPQKLGSKLIVHSSSLLSAIVCIIPIPCADHVMLSGVQTAMGASLGYVYGLDVGTIAKNTTGAANMATKIGKGTTQLLGNTLPGGAIINSCTAFVLTESLGWMLVKAFERHARNNLN